MPTVPPASPLVSSATKSDPPSPAAKAHAVFEWILLGATEFEIVEAIKTLWPEEEAPVIVAAVMQKLQDSAEFDSKIVIGWCFEATRDLYRRMVEIADFAGALRAIKQMADLAGLKRD